MWHKPGSLLNPECLVMLNEPIPGAAKIEKLPYEYRYCKKLAAGSTLGATLNFFNTPIGGTDGGVVMDESRTNIKAANQIEHPYSFLVMGVCVSCCAEPDSAVAVKESAATLRTLLKDITQVMRAGLLRFKTLDREFINVADLYRLPEGAGPTGAVAVSQAGEVAASHDAMFLHSNGLPAMSNVWPCEIPLGPKQTYYVTVEFPGYKPVLDGAYDLRLGVYLRGILKRNG